jgi:hypothetical protein
MRKLTTYLLAGCLLAPAVSFAQGPDSAGEKEAARDLGAVLAWRLGPEAVEERCRSVDPEGNESRKKALQAWLDKNARLIRAVDERVAEVAPLVVPPSKKADAVGAVRGQVKAILLEAIFAGTPEEAAGFCKGEANPASPRWTSNGMPHVQNSLAALYDWKIQQSGK